MVSQHETAPHCKPPAQDGEVAALPPAPPLADVALLARSLWIFPRRVRSIILARSYSAITPCICTSSRRSLADGPFDEVHLNAASVQLLDQDVLVNVVSGEPVGAVDEHAIKKAVRRCVTQRIQTWTVEPRAAESLVNVASRRGHGEAHRGRCTLESFNLRGHGPFLFLPRGRDAGVERSPQCHGVLLSFCFWSKHLTRPKAITERSHTSASRGRQMVAASNIVLTARTFGARA
jgi:hypothetical protein